MYLCARGCVYACVRGIFIGTYIFLFSYDLFMHVKHGYSARVCVHGRVQCMGLHAYVRAHVCAYVCA